MALRGKRLLVVDEDDESAARVASAAGAGGATVTRCRGGRAALAEVAASGAEGAVVDLPLRDVRGDAFLIALRDRGVACVAVSGVLKGERYAEIARQFGAAGFFEKPFQVEEALAALGRAIAAATSASASSLISTPSPSPPSPSPSTSFSSSPQPSAPTPSSTSTSTATTSGAPAGQPSHPRAPATGRSSAATAPAEPSQPSERAPLRDERGQGQGQSSTSASPSPSDPEPDFDSLIFSAARPALDETLPGVPLSPRPRVGLAMPLPEAASSRRPQRACPPALPAGDLASTRVPRLLTALHAARASGALTVARGEVKALLGFEDGRPVFAISNVPSQRFGACAVREGVVTQAALASLAAEIGPGARTAEALLARGLLDPERRSRMVEEQIRDVVWSTFGWRDGRYRLIANPFAGRELVRVDLALGALILEGVRRTASLDSLRRDLPCELALAQGTAPGFAPEELELAPAEASMLAHADGTKTVADLLALGGLPEREALAFLQASRDMGMLDEVSRVLAGTRRIGFM